MAAQINWERLKSDWLSLDNLRLEEPEWLLLAILPLALLLLYVWQRRTLTDLHWKNEIVRDSSVVINRHWPRHWITVIMVISMLLLTYPAARPVNSTVQTEEKTLLIWVYDASSSMSTVDVGRNDALISRLEASVIALEESLPDIPPDFHKLLISFAGADEITVNLPTFSNAELLAQARQIPRGEYTATDFGLERAVSVCQQFFNNRDNYPCEVFLLSDGECNPRPQCRLRSEDIAAEAADKGIVIHTVSWGDPRSDYRPNPEDMQAIADAGEGRHLVSAETSELAALYKNVAAGVEVQTVDHALAMPLVWISRGLIVALGLAFWLRRLE